MDAAAFGTQKTVAGAMVAVGIPTALALRATASRGAGPEIAMVLTCIWNATADWIWAAAAAGAWEAASVAAAASRIVSTFDPVDRSDPTRGVWGGVSCVVVAALRVAGVSVVGAAAGE